MFVAVRPDSALCGIVEVAIHAAAPGCVTDRIGYIEGWYVNEAWRGQDVGHSLIEAAETWARAQGCLEMASDTIPDYPLSPIAHLHLGYKESEQSMHYYKTL